jgi:hypothetical protein
MLKIVDKDGWYLVASESETGIGAQKIIGVFASPDREWNLMRAKECLARMRKSYRHINALKKIQREEENES